jgi:pyridoxine 4-dehydrogenase
VAVQNRYLLLDRGAADVLACCEQNDIAFVPYFPLAAGLLRPDIDRSRLPPGMGLSAEQEKTLDTIATYHGVTRSQVALAWLLAVSPVILLIPGTSSVARLEENLGAANVKLSTTDLALLDTFA